MIPRNEHPRPDFQRPSFWNLNGVWQFEMDDDDLGTAQHWYEPGHSFSREILVPFVYQSKASGIGPTDEIHPILWYRRTFQADPAFCGRRVLLRFGAVDWACDVYVNGRHVGAHEGGYTPFALDITDALCEGDNDVCLRVTDTPDTAQPRGKQYWRRGLMGCWYTPVSGIWQTVYMETVEDTYLERVHMIPDVDHECVSCELSLNRIPAQPLEAEIRISCKGTPVRTQLVSICDRDTRVSIDLGVRSAFGGLDHVMLWTPDQPALYDTVVTLKQADRTMDQVQTYFGMRKIEVRNGRIYLNNCPIYLRMVLDQGYWQESLLTPPSDEAIQTDIRLTLDMGYNGARKHQKVEDPRYYYWADRMGLLVWGELPSAYDFGSRSMSALSHTLEEFMDRDMNHPSLICWVPLNESWGVRQIYTDPRQQAFGRMLYHMVKARDGSRLVSGNDGWEQTTTDICALHDYAADGSTLAAHFQSREQVEKHACDWRPCWAEGETPRGTEAFMITEYGGIAFTNIGLQGDAGGMETWGYHDKVENEDDFFARFGSLMDALRAIPYCQGYCYTQLTDVMQEVNGLLTPDRRPKVDIRRFRSLNRGPDSLTNQTL